MKNILKFSLLTIILTLLSSCGAKERKQLDEQDSAGISEQEIRLDNEFITPDLAMYELHGHVREMVLTITDPTSSDPSMNDLESGMRLTFNEEGRLTSLEESGNVFTYAYDQHGNFESGKMVAADGSVLKVMRDYDSSGRLIHEEAVAENGAPSDLAFQCNYIWGNTTLSKIEFSAWETKSVRTLTYNEVGNLTLTQEKVTDVGYESNSEIHYTYSIFDKMSNWTERNVLIAGTVDMDEGETKEHPDHFDYSCAEKRTISYYQ